MSNEMATQVANVTLHEQALTEIDGVDNHLTCTGFVLVLNDEDGNPHELGINTFGLLNAQDVSEAKTLSAGLAESTLDRPIETTVSAFTKWLKAQ